MSDEQIDYINSLDQFDVDVNVETLFTDNEFKHKYAELNNEIKHKYAELNGRNAIGFGIALKGGLVDVIARKVRKKYSFMLKNLSASNATKVLSIVVTKIKFRFRCTIFHDRKRNFYSFSCYSPNEVEEYFYGKAIGLACDRALVARSIWEKGIKEKIYKVKGIITPEVGFCKAIAGNGSG